MQNRYAGDIGDYIKLALLRHLSLGKKLGIAWYLYPDEGHNADGRHIDYLSNPKKWRHLDPDLFDALTKVASGTRSVARLQSTGAIDPTQVSSKTTLMDVAASERSNARAKWFNQNLHALAGCDLVFADPDNGITDDGTHRRRQKTFGKQMPLSEVLALAEGRSAVIYHHNTRFKGGHDKEVEYWLAQLGQNTLAVRANAYSCRTLFVLNPDKYITTRTIEFCQRWSDHKVRLHSRT